MCAVMMCIPGTTLVTCKYCQCDNTVVDEILNRLPTTCQSVVDDVNIRTQSCAGLS